MHTKCSGPLWALRLDLMDAQGWASNHSQHADRVRNSVCIQWVDWFYTVSKKNLINLAFDRIGKRSLDQFPKFFHFRIIGEIL